jgi:hypothetical protein
MNTDNKLSNYLKITGIIKCLDQRKPQSKSESNYTVHYLFQVCYTAVKIGPLKQEMQQEQQQQR